MQGRCAITQQVFEDRRHAQHDGEYPQALCGSDTAQRCTITCAEVDHLPGTARHAGEERRRAILSGTQHQPHADQARQAGDQGADENQPEVRQHLFDDHRGEVQADADPDDQLTAFATAGNLRQLPGCQAAHQNDCQQRAHHPRQRPADLAGEVAAQQADQRRCPPLAQRRISHASQRPAVWRACARCATAGTAA